MKLSKLNESVNHADIILSKSWGGEISFTRQLGGQVWTNQCILGTKGAEEKIPSQQCSSVPSVDSEIPR